MWCGVLGPLVVRRSDGTTPAIGGPARRLVFGALLSRAGRTVPAEVLIADVWGQAPPRTAAKTLQSHIVRLRHDLGRDEADAVLVTERQGYRLVLGPDEFDVAQFEAGVAGGLAAAADGRVAEALTLLDDSLGLWRGEAYEEFADAAFSVPERLRLFELHAQAEERHTDLALDLGQTDELVPQLEKRVAAAPYRERGWEQLIVALYRAGRQADALGAYRRAARTLAEDLGVEPSPALRDLEVRILRQDPSLIAASGTPAAVVIPDGRREACPYRGLATYTDAESDLFVGRERLTAELVGLLADHRAVVVAGASGTGKSSMLRAGLVAALRSGALPGSSAWRTDVMTPGQYVGSTAGDLDLVVIDQAEELFTLLTSGERHAVADRLEQYTAGGGRLVLALRGDYYGRLAELQPLAAYARAASVLVGPLRDDELRRVVVEPAERVGLAVDDELIETVLDDVAGQPAALPMLSTALVRTWENRQDGRLTLEGYRRGGGVALAVEATAEDAHLTLDDAGRTAVRRLLLRLAGREGDAWVRRPIRRSDAAPDQPAEAALAALTTARLVTVAQDRVEITHDALLVHWPRLRGWLEERVLGAELLDHLNLASRSWADAGRPASDLYRGARLRGALDWRDEHPDDVAATDEEFLAASEAAADAELTAARAQTEREARGRRRLRGVAAGLAAMVVLAALGAGVALHERTSARRAAQTARAAALSADARRLAALSANAPDIATSSLLAVAAYRLQDSSDTRGALLDSVERNSSALWRVHTVHRLLQVVATPDGTRVAVIDNRRVVHVFDTHTRHELAHFAARGDLLAGITPDARDVLVYGPDLAEDPVGRLSVVDIASGRRVHVLTTDGMIKPEIEPAQSMDGRWLVQLTTERVRSGVVVDVFDTSDWSAPPRRFSVPSRPSGVAAGRYALAVEHADGSVEVRALPSLQVVGRVAARFPAMAGGSPLGVTPDGSEIAVEDGRDPRRVSIIRVAGSAAIPVPTQAQDAAFAFSPDGGQLAVTTLGGAVTVYRTSDGSQAEALAGHAGPVIGVAWSGLGKPTGLYTSGLDDDLISWSVNPTPRLVTESGPDITGLDSAQVFGRHLLGLTPVQTDTPGSRLKLVGADLMTGRWSTWSPGMKDDEYLGKFAASVDGRRGLLSIVDYSGHNRIEVWDLLRHVQVGRLALPRDAPATFPLGFIATMTPDGSTAYSSLGPARIGEFSLPSGRYLRSFTVRFAQPDAARVVAQPWGVDPAGRLLVYGFDTGPHKARNQFNLGPNDARAADHRLLVVDPRTGHTVAQTGLGDIVALSAASWSHDGHMLVVGTVDGSLTLFDAATLRARATSGAAESGYVAAATFAPDDRTVLSSGTSGALNFWSVPNLDRVAQRLPLGDSANNSGVLAWYAPDGDVVGFAHDDAKPGSGVQRWFRFRSGIGDLVRTACGLAGGAMTPAQWRRYVADQPLRRVC